MKAGWGRALNNKDLRLLAAALAVLAVMAGAVLVLIRRLGNSRRYQGS